MLRESLQDETPLPSRLDQNETESSLSHPDCPASTKTPGWVRPPTFLSPSLLCLPFWLQSPAKSGSAFHSQNGRIWRNGFSFHSSEREAFSWFRLHPPPSPVVLDKVTYEMTLWFPHLEDGWGHCYHCGVLGGGDSGPLSVHKKSANNLKIQLKKFSLGLRKQFPSYSVVRPHHRSLRDDGFVLPSCISRQAPIHISGTPCPEVEWWLKKGHT